jgi:VWFA-related protein
MLKNHHKHRFSLAFVILCLTYLFFSPSDESAQSGPKKTGQKKENEKLEITIDVDYFLLDVLAFDEEGQHVLDLTKNDFELMIDGQKVQIASLDKYTYMTDSSLRKISPSEGTDQDSKLIEFTNDFVLDENGFQKEITPYIGNGLSMNSQPPRTFAIVFANLPMLPIRWQILKDGLIDYITNYLEDNTQIAIFSMGMQELGIIQPFTRDRSAVIKTIRTYLDSRWIDRKKDENYNDNVKRSFDLDEESDYFYLMADSPTPDLDHSTSSWIISGFDTIIIQQNTVFALFKQFDIIINKLSEIPGRKNLLLFSEGFPYVPETMFEYIRTRDRMRLLVSRMNKYNISLYTFDMFTSRNLGASGVRAGLLADLSSSTNGVFFKWLGNSKKKITSSLVQTDMMTENYYLVGFYLNGIKLKDDSRAELSVKRKGVNLVYNEWLKGKKSLTTDRYLNEMESSRKLFAEKKYSEIPESLTLHFLPGDQRKTWTVISSQFPSMDIVVPEQDNTGKIRETEKISDLEADLLLTLDNESRKEVHYVFKKIEIPSEKLTEKVIYNYRILLEPGLYVLKSVLHSRNNGKTVSSERDITVPDFYFENNLHSITILDEKNKSFTIQNPIQTDNKLKFEIDKLPFYPGGTLLLPAHIPEFKVSETVTFYLYCNRIIGEVILPSITLISDESAEKMEILNAVFQKPIPFLDDFQVIRGEFKIPLLKPGKYTLHSTLLGDDRNGVSVDLLIKED